MCVCVTPVTKGYVTDSYKMQGSVALASYHTQRSCGCKWEARLDQSYVPAHVVGMGTVVQLVATNMSAFHVRVSERPLPCTVTGQTNKNQPGVLIGSNNASKAKKHSADRQTQYSGVRSQI